MIMQAGKGSVEYIFTEKNFGQFASNEEVGKKIRELAKWQEILFIYVVTCCRFLLFVHQHQQFGTEDILSGQPEKMVASWSCQASNWRHCQVSVQIESSWRQVFQCRLGYSTPLMASYTAYYTTVRLLQSLYSNTVYGGCLRYNRYFKIFLEF